VTSALTVPLRWDPATAIRGTVVVLHGRGEHGGVYERLGRRLSADGYAVAAPDLPDGEDAALAGRPAHGPFVLVGSDTGAIRALELCGPASTRPDALVLAGLPLPASPADGPPPPVFTTWEQELDARTTCADHRARLDGDARFRRGALSEPVGPTPAALPDLPVLVVHGTADAVAPLAAVRSLVATAPRASLAVVADGRHDALNDAEHRSVAAHVVLFLEAVRSGRVPVSLVTP
jgi:pimeloyl-ACP methyl ester carboxylesterase